MSKQPSIPSTSAAAGSGVNAPKEALRQQPEDLDATKNNEPTNEFQARTIELRTQRPQWVTYYQ